MEGKGVLERTNGGNGWFNRTMVRPNLSLDECLHLGVLTWCKIWDKSWIKHSYTIKWCWIDRLWGDHDYIMQKMNKHFTNTCERIILNHILKWNIFLPIWKIEIEHQF